LCCVFVIGTQWFAWEFDSQKFLQILIILFVFLARLFYEWTIWCWTLLVAMVRLPLALPPHLPPNIWHKFSFTNKNYSSFMCVLVVIEGGCAHSITLFLPLVWCHLGSNWPLDLECVLFLPLVWWCLGSNWPLDLEFRATADRNKNNNSCSPQLAKYVSQCCCL
jgi:hypothetical protein